MTTRRGKPGEPSGFTAEAVVLAAGLGSRMGRIKPLVPIHGRPSLAHVLDRLADAGVEKPIVVLGHGAKEIRRNIDLSKTRIVMNDTPSHGMASSLVIGLRAISEHAAGALVLHADMPFVTASTIRAVVETAADGALLSAPRFQGRRGFPVYFAKPCFSELIAGLHGEIGGREYIETHKKDLVSVDVNDEGILVDIDRPEDVPVQTGRIASRS